MKSSNRVHYFPGFPPSQPITVRFTDVGYKKMVRSNECGIYTLKLPKAFNPTNDLFTHSLAASFGLMYGWTSTPMVMQEPKCTGNQYLGPKWNDAGGEYYLYREGNTIKVWRDYYTPFTDISFVYFTDEYVNTLERSVKADVCGVVKVSTKWDNYDYTNEFSGNSGYLIWDVSQENPWIVGGISYAQPYIDTNPGEYICRSGNLYK